MSVIRVAKGSTLATHALGGRNISPPLTASTQETETRSCWTMMKNKNIVVLLQQGFFIY